MANIARNIAFAVALDYLYEHGIVTDQQELSAKTGISESTISRILNDKVKKPSEDTIRKLNATFENMFNPQFFRCESEVLLLKDIVGTKVKQKEETKQESTIIELYAHLIQEVENLRRDLVAEIEEVHQLRTQLADEVEHLRTTSEHITHIIGVTYPQSDSQIPIAAEPNTTQL